eukprot:3281663-Prymnesium_polylepis.1
MTPTMHRALAVGGGAALAALLKRRYCGEQAAHERGARLVGRRVRVWWDGDRTWYEGQVRPPQRSNHVGCGYSDHVGCGYSNHVPLSYIGP